MMPKLVQIGSGEVGVLRLGSTERPPVLLVHGFSGDLLTWQYNLLPLAKDYHVVAIDLPGHGRSGPATGSQHWRDMVDWLAEAVAALGLVHPHLIGHSLGGRLVLGLVENRLVAARSLSLLACAGVGPGHDYPFLKRLAAIETLDDALACSRHLFADAAVDLDRMARAMYAKLTLPAAKAALDRILADNFEDGRLRAAVSIDWARIGCPVQLIWARDDQVNEVPDAGSLPADLEFHLLERGGHLPHIAAADQVNRLLGTFVRRVDQAASQVSKVAPQE
jgi:pyruvate dehydrogenase E2 component (dihydrolipoamide acetyltransferase)